MSQYKKFKAEIVELVSQKEKIQVRIKEIEGWLAGYEEAISQTGGGR